jgi:AraC-like DNA-binding protein
MSSAGPSLDVEWDFRTGNLEAYRARVATLLKPFSLTGRAGGYYDARLAHRRLWRSEISVIGYGEEVLVEAGTMNDFYLLQLPLHGSYAMGSKERAVVVRQGQAHLIHNAMPLHMEFSADLTLLVLKFDRRHFAAFAADEAGRRPAEHQRSGYILPLDRGFGPSLRRAVEFTAVETLARCPFGNRLEPRPLAEALLVETIRGSFQASFAGEGNGPSIAVPSYVRRAEAFITANLKGDVTLDDIVAASRVSARTLFHGFRKVHGIGPWAWARARRLEGARDSLAAGNPSSTRVTDIALDWGFTHLGRFSAAYRLRFGESPSETLASRD